MPDPRIFRPVGTLVCFVSVELIEVKTELAGDTLDGIRDDEMNVALNNIFQSKYDPHQVIKSLVEVNQANISLVVFEKSIT